MVLAVCQACFYCANVKWDIVHHAPQEGVSVYFVLYRWILVGNRTRRWLVVLLPTAAAPNLMPNLRSTCHCRWTKNRGHATTETIMCYSQTRKDYSLRPMFDREYKPWFSCQMFDRPSYLKKLWKKLKRQVTHKILIMFYHLTTMKIRIIKKFHIRRTVKVGHGNPGFVFFWTEGLPRIIPCPAGC